MVFLRRVRVKGLAQVALSTSLLLPLGAQTPAPAAASASAPAAASAPPASASAASAPAQTTAAAEAAKSTATASTATTTPAAPTNPAVSNPNLQQQIAKLPPIQNSGIDADAQGKLILQHLNAMLRFYHDAVLPIQKVGEPSDVLYDEQSASEAAQIARLAFQASKNQATLLGKLQGAPAAAGSDAATPTQPTEAQRMATLRTQVAQQMAALQASDDALDQQIAKAKPADVAALRQQKQQVEGGLELQKAMSDALSRLTTTTDAQSQKGLAGDIERLQRSAPELASNATKPATPPPPESLSSAREAGVSSQAVWIFQLLSTLHTIDTQIATVDLLRKQADDLRQPIVKILRGTVQQGQALSQQAVNLQATPTTDRQDLANTRKTFDNLTTEFQVLSGATLPLSQEVTLLEQTRGTLTTWHTAVDEEYKMVLRSLLLRVGAIAAALIVIGLISQFWSHATIKYVADLRRRRQFLLVRRVVIGFLSGLVLIFGFVTQFSSLATFAGFITAGIAVGLQTILLSVAAYFFIIGRYGVRVGDRITVAGVTGDVIEVGLVRFYMMEMGGTSTELHPTGRVAVFANSVLFQTGTPLYKQMPGTEYAWHELTLNLKPTADVPRVSDDVLGTVKQVYAGYEDKIVGQHRAVETWMGMPAPAPEIESHLQLVDAGLQLQVIFPVEIANAAEVDSKLAELLIQRINTDGPLKDGAAAPPVIKPSIKA